MAAPAKEMNTEAELMVATRARAMGKEAAGMKAAAMVEETVLVD